MNPKTFSSLDIALDAGAGATAAEVGHDSAGDLMLERNAHPEFQIPETTAQDETLAIYIDVSSRLLQLSEMDRTRFLKFIGKLYIYAQMPPQLCHLALCLAAREKGKVMGPSAYARKLSVTRAGPSRENLQHLERLRSRFRSDPEWMALLDVLVLHSGGAIAQ